MSASIRFASSRASVRSTVHAIVAGACLWPAFAASQEPPADDLRLAAADVPGAPLEEIVVQSAAERIALTELKETPKSVSVVLEEDLAKFEATGITEVLRRLGNVRWNFGNPRTGSFSMRGLTAGAGNDKVDPSVGLTIDGVPYAYLPLAAGSDFIDLEQINVTRGPQGTLGAKQTSVGQINIITRKPSFEREASASLTLGQDNALRAQAQIGGPVIDDVLAWRITVERNQQDGAFLNDYPDLKGRQSYVNVDRTYGRAQLLFTPSEDFAARLVYDYQPNGGEYLNGLTFRKDTPDSYANGAPVDKTNTAFAKLSRRWFAGQEDFSPQQYYTSPVFLDNNGPIITGTRGSLLDLDWHVGPGSLQSLSSWREHYFSAQNDDGTPFDISRNGGFITTYQQFTQELKFVSDTGGFFDYVVGAFYLTSTANSISRTRYGQEAGPYNANVAQYGTLDVTAAGRSLMVDSLARVYRVTQTYLDNESEALFAQANWHLTERLTLTTGLRGSREKRQTTESVLIEDNGYGAALNPVSINNVPLGGFNSTGTGALAAGNTASQLSLADQVANKYFGAAVTTTPGAAYNGLTAAQRAQVAAAKAIRLQQFGTLYALAPATPYEGDLLTSQLSLTNTFSDSLTGYLTWQHGEKPGISQFNGANAGGGIPLPTRAEKTDTYEFGVRSELFDRTLAVNAGAFFADFRDFQQSVYYYDDVATRLANDGVLRYSSGIGNVGKVRSKGIEADLVYRGLPNTSIRFSGAYTDAEYVDHPFSGQPVENGNLATRFRDVSGYTLQNAPKWQFNLTADYRVPVFGDKAFHASASYTYSSRENGDLALSDYSWRSGYGLADLSIGFGRADDSFDANVVVKNVLDEDFGDIGWDTVNVNTRPRWIGLVLSGRFY